MTAVVTAASSGTNSNTVFSQGTIMIDVMNNTPIKIETGATGGCGTGYSPGTGTTMQYKLRARLEGN